MTLSEAKYGQEVQIKSINPKLKESDRSKIQSMGFYPSAWLKVEAVGLLKGPILVQCMHEQPEDEEDMYDLADWESTLIKDAKVIVSRRIANLIEVE